MGGSVIMENIFNLNQRLPDRLGVNLVFATVVVAVNLLTDLSYAVIDPRVRYR